MVKNAITLKSVFVTLLMLIRIAHIFVIDKISNYGKSVISRIFWWGIKILFRCLCLPTTIAVPSPPKNKNEQSVGTSPQSRKSKATNADIPDLLDTSPGRGVHVSRERTTKKIILRRVVSQSDRRIGPPSSFKEIIPIVDMHTGAKKLGGEKIIPVEGISSHK